MVTDTKNIVNSCYRRLRRRDAIGVAVLPSRSVSCPPYSAPVASVNARLKYETTCSRERNRFTEPSLRCNIISLPTNFSSTAFPTVLKCLPASISSLNPFVVGESAARREIVGNFDGNSFFAIRARLAHLFRGEGFSRSVFRHGSKADASSKRLTFFLCKARDPRRATGSFDAFVGTARRMLHVAPRETRPDLYLSSSPSASFRDTVSPDRGWCQECLFRDSLG